MHYSSSHRVLQVHDLHIWLVSQGIDLTPEHRNAASDLHKAHFGVEIIENAFSRRLAYKHQLFGFIEVGNMPFVINAPPKIASPRTEARTPTNQADLDVMAVQESWAYVERFVFGQNVIAVTYLDCTHCHT